MSKYSRTILQPGKWATRLQVSENPLEIVYDFVNEFLEKFSQANHTTYQVAVSYNSEASKMARTPHDIDGWRLNEKWFFQLLMGLFEVAGLPLDDPKLVMMADDLGWDLSSWEKPTYDRVNTVKQMEYFAAEDEFGNKIFKTLPIVMIPTSPYPNGSLWKSTVGKVWECEGEIRPGEYLLIAETPHPTTGHYKHLAIPEHLLGAMTRVL